MPHKHTIKTYVEEGYYHVYNRGVEKRIIYSDKQDYKVFLHLLKHYLSNVEKPEHPLQKLKVIDATRPRSLQTIGKQIDLLAFCLMPNHFHLLLKQYSKDGMSKFLRALSTTYAMYFNRRHNRIGYLFQGRYKAVLIQKDEYLLHLSRYIHLNPSTLKGTDPLNYPNSSLPYYLKKKTASWIKPNFILSYFKSPTNPSQSNIPLSYQEFVMDYEVDPKDAAGHLSID